MIYDVVDNSPDATLSPERLRSSAEMYPHPNHLRDWRRVWPYGGISTRFAFISSGSTHSHFLLALGSVLDQARVPGRARTLLDRYQNETLAHSGSSHVKRSSCQS